LSFAPPLRHEGQAYRGLEIIGVMVEALQGAKGGEGAVSFQIFSGIAQEFEKVVDGLDGGQSDGVRFSHGFSFPWLLSMARKKPGRYAAGVNGLHGHSARAPVDDGGRPGKLSQKIDNKQKEKEEKTEMRAVFFCT